MVDTDLFKFWIRMAASSMRNRLKRFPKKTCTKCTNNGLHSPLEYQSVEPSASGANGDTGFGSRQEASNVGLGFALAPDDWYCPSFREYGAMFLRGAKPRNFSGIGAETSMGPDYPMTLVCYRCV